MNNLNFDLSLAKEYKSQPQRIRVLSENWLEKTMYCPCCGHLVLRKFNNNKPVADFYCERCQEQFELKSCDKGIKKKIADGAYSTAIERVNSNSNPDLFILQYNEFTVRNLIVVPKYFFTPEIIEKRKPLSENARRAGWVGCNILYGSIPIQGKIDIIVNGVILPTDIVCSKYKQANRLKIDDISKRGWLFDVLNCVNLIRSETFSLKDIYQFEEKLQLLHPSNNNIRDKIRQQLQILRDKGLIEFIDNKGHYKKKMA